MEYTVIGDTVNTASLIQGVAKAGEIYISEEINQKINERINTSKLEPIKLKNKQNEIILYKILNKREIKHSINKILPLSGREKEIKCILDIFGENYPSKEKTIIIDGEAGIGKSRIIEEIIKKIDNNNYFVFTTIGNFYTKQFLWQPFKEIFFNLISFLYSFMDSNDKIDNLETQISYIQNYFNQNDEKSEILLTREAIYYAFKVLFQEFIKFKKFIFICEDIQFFDEASLELLNFLIRTLKNENIYFLITKRSDFNWGNELENIKTIDLKNLTKKECKILSNNFFENKVGKDLLKYIVNYSNGNPNFIVELLQNIKNNDYIELINGTYEFKKDENIISNIPTSISSLILSRVDKLNFKEKNILINASFFGKRISFDILKELCDVTDYETIINKLIEYGYFIVQIINEKKYIFFIHQTMCDAIYESVLDKKKREIHLKIANLLLARYKDRESKIYERLGFHFEQSYDNYKAIYYYFMSGIKYRNIYDFDTSTKWLYKAYNLAKVIQDDSKEIIFF
ncbi:MAG TPA: AAA family ATPase, partial [Spirochaetota bacterium]|nr:AAA family ATPase [Spirochaetota bacterium]